MNAYNTPTINCPYCQNETHADWVDNGVGMVQCGPYHCRNCGASEIGPELYDWYYNDRQGGTIYLLGKRKYNSWTKSKTQEHVKPVLKPNHPFTKAELETGFYQKKISPYANTSNGKLVNHKQATILYHCGLLDDKDI